MASEKEGQSRAGRAHIARPRPLTKRERELAARLDEVVARVWSQPITGDPFAGIPNSDDHWNDPMARPETETTT